VTGAVGGGAVRDGVPVRVGDWVGLVVGGVLGASDRDVSGGCVTDGPGVGAERSISLPVKCCTAIRASSAAKPATSAIQRDHRGPRGCWSGGGGGPPESSIHS
jgi:hypothetical protein